jgi:hypothetical protein
MWKNIVERDRPQMTISESRISRPRKSLCGARISRPRKSLCGVFKEAEDVTSTIVQTLKTVLITAVEKLNVRQKM